MGFDGVASQAILFIAVISASAVLIIAFQTQLSDSASTASIKQKALSEQLKTEIIIESVSYNITAENTSVYVKNIGKTSIKPQQISVYVDDQWTANTTRSQTLVSDTNTINPTIWDPNEVLLVVVNQELDTDLTHSIAIATPYGTREEYEFTP
jgi:archaellum component FlaG (FlaF/FlaG flagellin family)